MTTDMTDHLCRAPRWLCLSPKPAERGPRGLCMLCEAGIPNLLDVLVRDWADLTPLLVEETTTGGQHVDGTPEHRTPLNLHADELQGRLVHLAVAWEDHTLDAVSKPSPDRVGVLPAWRLSRATRTLGTYRPAWLALEARPYTWDPERKPADMDGPGSVVEMMTLHRQVRATTGVRKLVTKLHGRCMECGWSQTLRREDGSDVVYCSVCRYEITMDVYDQYLACFTPALQGRT